MTPEGPNFGFHSLINPKNQTPPVCEHSIKAPWSNGFKEEYISLRQRSCFLWHCNAIPEQAELATYECQFGLMGCRWATVPRLELHPGVSQNGFGSEPSPSRRCQKHSFLSHHFNSKELNNTPCPQTWLRVVFQFLRHNTINR